MATQVQFRRGTTADISTFIGADGEVVVDTTKKTCVVNDGVQIAGYPLLREDGSNSALNVGSLSSCALKFVNDPNTGIISPGADQIALVTGGASRLSVDSSGSVTIPGNLLVAGSVTSSITFDNGSAAVPALRFTNDPDTGIYLAGTNELAISTGGTQRLTTTTTAVTSTLPVIHPLGAAATPSLTFTGDTNTGIYSPGADQVAISTNGTGRLFVSSTGRVGLGTASSISPSAPLDDFHIASTDPAVLLEETDAGVDEKYWRIRAEGSILRFEGVNDGFNSTQSWLNVTRTTGARTVDNIAFNTGTNERLRITSAGRLLLNTPNEYFSTTSASTTPLLQVHSTNHNAAQVLIQSWNSGQAVGANLTLARADSGTIGTYSPALQATDLLGTIRFSGADGAKLIEGATISALADSNWNTDDGPTRLVFSTTPSGSATPTERLRITSAGLVGIGTASPGARLGIQEASAGEAIVLYSADGNGAGFIGTTNQASTSNGIVINANRASGSLVFETVSNERARIDSSGRLLVGTSSAIQTVSNGFNSSSYFSLAGSATANTNIAANYFANNSTGASGLSLSKSRNSTVGSHAILASGDRIGSISYNGSDGTAFIEAAQITADVDGTPGLNDMPGRLVFSTTADGASSPTERMRITSAGLVGIGTTSPSVVLQVASPNSNTAETVAGFGNQTIANGLQITTNGNLDWGFNALNTRNLTFSTNQLERARIDSSGRLLVGTSSAYAVPNYAGTSITPQLQTSATTIAGGAYANIGWYVGASNGPSYVFARSNSDTPGTYTAVSASSSLGNISFAGSDGSAFVTAASISSQCDGTPGANDMPGRLVFSTTADGASSPTERMRITSAGLVGIGTTSPTAKLTIRETSTAAGAADLLLISTAGGGGFNIECSDLSAANPDWAIRTFANEAIVFKQGTDERARIDSSGRLLVGTSSALSVNNVTAGVEVHSTATNNGAAVSIARFNNDASAPQLILGKSRNSTIAAGTIVQNGDELGQITFNGDDGTDLNSTGARIQAFVDGAPGANDMPGRLVFSTTADGASSPTERMRISSNGSLTVTGVGGSEHTIATNSAERIRWNDNGSYITTLPTTGSGANVHIWTGSSPANLLMLSTSSQRYKTSIEDLDADRSNAVLNFRPVWYRSTCELDRKDWSWYGLIAEEVAEIEPRLVHWTYLDDAYDLQENEDGTTEKVLKEDAELVPNGVQYDRLTVLLLDLAQRQEQRIAELEAAVAALQQS